MRSCKQYSTIRFSCEVFRSFHQFNICPSLMCGYACGMELPKKKKNKKMRTVKTEKHQRLTRSLYFNQLQCCNGAVEKEKP